MCEIRRRGISHFLCSSPHNIFFYIFLCSSTFGSKKQKYSRGRASTIPFLCFPINRFYPTTTSPHKPRKLPISKFLQNIRPFSGSTLREGFKIPSHGGHPPFPLIFSPLVFRKNPSAMGGEYPPFR